MSDTSQHRTTFSDQGTSERDRIIQSRKGKREEKGVHVIGLDIPFYDLWCLTWKIIAIQLVFAVFIGGIWIFFVSVLPSLF